MATISLCMIVKNEEKVLERCLDSAKSFADEIIIVDTGSTDRTKEIAEKYTDRVYDFEWKDDFSAARNEAFSRAVMDYCMWLDADDVVAKEQQEKIKELKRTISLDTSVVMMKYVMSFDETGKPVFSYYRERLLRNGLGFRWQGRVHEAISPAGRVLYSDIEIEHRKVESRGGYSDRNLKIYQKMEADGEKFTPRDLFYYGRELYYFAPENVEYLKKAKRTLEEFLNSPDGWRENKIEACRFLSLCRQMEGDWEGEVAALARSFVYDRPRAEISCDIGNCFFRRENYRTAAFWYETALNTEKCRESGGFVREECYDYIPALQLTVCYYRMGDMQKAELFNEIARKIHPESQACIFNRSFFEKQREIAQTGEQKDRKGKE